MGNFSEETVLNWTFQIFSALNYIHSKKVKFPIYILFKKQIFIIYIYINI